MSEGNTALGFMTAGQGWDAYEFEIKTQFSFELAGVYVEVSKTSVF